MTVKKKKSAGETPLRRKSKPTSVPLPTAIGPERPARGRDDLLAARAGDVRARARLLASTFDKMARSPARTERAEALVNHIWTIVHDQARLREETDRADGSSRRPTQKSALRALLTSSDSFQGLSDDQLRARFAGSPKKALYLDALLALRDVRPGVVTGGRETKKYVIVAAWLRSRGHLKATDQGVRKALFELRSERRELRKHGERQALLEAREVLLDLLAQRQK